MSKQHVVVTFMNGPEDGLRVSVDGASVSIGQDPSNDVVINFDPRVASKHIELLHSDGQWLLVDRSEGAGVFVDGVRVHDHTPLLLPDKLVYIGDTLLRIDVGGFIDVAC